MLKIGVQTGGLDDRFGVDEAYRMIAEAGFDAVDANLDHFMSGRAILKDFILPEPFRPGLDERDMLEFFKPYRDAAKKYGLDNYQAHAPFPSFHVTEDLPEWNDALLEMLRKTLIGCASIGCRNLVIHPFFMDYDHRLTREQEWELNISRYSALAATARQYGITINLENMFVRHSGKLYAACCNNGQTAAAYVDELNRLAGARCFGFCLDTGHALLVGLDILEFMRDLGKRITCFHIHDNDGRDDLHEAPYTGQLDWNRFVQGLAETGFGGTLCFETHRAVLKVDPALIPETLNYIAACGRLFARRAEEFKKS